MLALLRQIAPSVASFFVGTCVLWTGQVGPDEPVANWAKWLKLVGLDRVPPWLKTDEFYLATMGAGGLFALGGVVGLVMTWKRRRDLATPLVPVLPPDELISFREASARTYEEFQRKGSI